MNYYEIPRTERILTSPRSWAIGFAGALALIGGHDTMALANQQSGETANTITGAVADHFAENIQPLTNTYNSLITEAELATGHNITGIDFTALDDPRPCSDLRGPSTWDVVPCLTKE